LKSSYIQQRFHPRLESPVFIEGLPGYGNVGKIVAQTLIQFSGAELFAEYYSPFFPDYVDVSSDGICKPTHYDFYAPTSGEKLSVVILTGNSQPPFDNVVAHYEICEETLDFAQKLGCSFIVTVGGVPVSSVGKDVYVAATSNELTAEVVEKGGIAYRNGRIMGATGLLLGLASERRLDGVCLLGATSGLQSDKDSGRAVFKLLKAILGKKFTKKRRIEKEKG